MPNPPTTDRRAAPVRGDVYELRDRMGGRVPVQKYLNVLNALLRRSEDDLAGVEVGRLSDTARERAARKEVHDHLRAAREALIDALGHVQQIADPRLRFTLGVIVVGSSLLKEGMREQATEAVWTRHARGRWGTVTSDERGANELAVRRGVGRIISRLDLDGIKVVAITEADRAMTTILRAERY